MSEFYIALLRSATCGRYLQKGSASWAGRQRIGDANIQDTLLFENEVPVCVIGFLFRAL